MLGDGHLVGKTNVWDFKYNRINAAPCLAATVEVETAGNTLCFEADEFMCKKGPIIFNDLRSGVFYDARLEEEGWCEPGFEEKDWHKPILSLNPPRGYAKICEAEPIKIYREIKPVSIKKGGCEPYIMRGDVADTFGNTSFETDAESDGYIYDFGENNSGIIRLKIKGERGQKVSLQCSEQNVDGNINFSNINFYPNGFSQRDIYYLKGDGEEVFEPMFTYHGCRYVYVSGITEEQATEDLLTYMVMSSDLEERGSFECSDETVNKLYEMCMRSDRSNFFYFPTDCPHREKNGWTGDAATSAEHMIMTIGVENSWKEWMNNIRMAQKENGQLPGIVPTDTWGYEWGNGPAWDRVIFDLPYFAYKYRGETDIIKENATAMLRYLEYVSRKRDDKGIVAIGLGDWVPVIRNDGGKQSDAELGFTDSVMILDMCRKGEEMFDAVNLPMHKEFAKTLGDEMLEAVRREYIDFATYVVKGRYQTTQAMAIFYDVFNEDEKQKAFDVLKEIVAEDNYSMTSGYLGLRVIFHVLSQFGEAETAYKMITKKEYPSYRYWLDKGETTLLEQFCQYDKFFPDSKNHHFLGDIANWFMSCPGGIKVENCNEVVVNPTFLKDLDWCRTSHKLPDGEVQVSWNRTENGIKLNVNSTGNIKCRVEIGNSYTQICDGEYMISEK